MPKVTKTKMRIRAKITLIVVSPSCANPTTTITTTIASTTTAA